MEKNNSVKPQFEDFVEKDERERVLMYDPTIDLSITQEEVVKRLQNIRTEGDVFWPLKSYLYHGFLDFKKEVNDELNKFMWVLQFIWDINSRWHNLAIGWPTYPNYISVDKKSVGKPYDERIKESFDNLQWCVDRYYYALYKFFGNYINHDAWEIHLEWVLDAVCKAYASPVNDEFGLRKGLHIIQPDEQDLRGLLKEVVEFKKMWGDWKNTRQYGRKK